MSVAAFPPRASALGTATDAQLTSLVRQGNTEAFTALYRRHEGKVAAVAFRSASRDLARAEDIAQEAWASAYRALSGPGAPIDHAGPWLVRITRNVAHDRYRQDQRRAEVLVDDETVARVPAHGGVEDSLRAKQTLGRVMGAMDELNDTERRILQLRELGGLSYKQIADELGKPESAIETALFRARRKMAAEYRELDSGARCTMVQSQLRTGVALSRCERRRVERHLARCVPCERAARLAGVEVPAPRFSRIAGVLPLPGFLARMMLGGSETIGPVVSKGTAAAVVVVAGGSVVVGGQTLPTTADADTAAQSQKSAPAVVVSARTTAHGTQPQQALPLAVAPRTVKVKAHHVAAVSEHKAATGNAPKVRVRASIGTPVRDQEVPEPVSSPEPDNPPAAPAPKVTPKAPPKAESLKDAVQDEVHDGVDVAAAIAEGADDAAEEVTEVVTPPTAPPVPPVQEVVPPVVEPVVDAVPPVAEPVVEPVTPPVSPVEPVPVEALPTPDEPVEVASEADARTEHPCTSVE